MSESKFESVCFGLKWVSFKSDVKFKVNEKKSVRVAVSSIQNKKESEWVRVSLSSS